MTFDALPFVVAAIYDNPILFALLVIALEIPRYTFSIFVLALFGLRPLLTSKSVSPTISVIIPTHNGADGIVRTVQSIFASTCQPSEVIIVNDGSDDGTHQVVEELCLKYLTLKVITHSRRCGKSAAINHGARFATGEFLAIVDVDTQLEANALAQLCIAFDDTQVAAASGNILVSNAKQNPLTAIQSIEYLMSVSLGRNFLDYFGAVSCCSGAFSMFRTDVFRMLGGFNVGPGEDLEMTLRFRKAGYKVRFIRSAIARTQVPDGFMNLVRQRRRWDRDALNVRVFMYHQLKLRVPGEGLPDTLQRLDFIILELFPTIVYPFYLGILAVNFGSDIWPILSGVYIALFWLYGAHTLLAMFATKRLPSLLDIVIFPLIPVYQGMVMKFVRFYAFTEEILFSQSHRDDFVPERVRNALYLEKIK